MGSRGDSAGGGGLRIRAPRGVGACGAGRLAAGRGAGRAVAEGAACRSRPRSRPAQSAPTPPVVGTQTGTEELCHGPGGPLTPLGERGEKRTASKKKSRETPFHPKTDLVFWSALEHIFMLNQIRTNSHSHHPFFFFFFLRNYSGGRNCVYLSLPIYNPRRGAHDSEPQVSHPQSGHICLTALF